MKTNIVLAALLTVIAPTTLLRATNYTNYGTFAAYNLTSGDTLRIAQGNFTGVITSLPSGAVIIVAPNATFSPLVINFWAPVGKIVNNGTCNFSGMGIGAGFNLVNNGNIAVQGDMSFYSGTMKTVINSTGSSISVFGSLSMNDNTTITNDGYINTTGSVNLYSSSAQLTNRGVINAGASFSSQGILNNQNIINVTNDFNFWGGTVANTGQISPRGAFSIGSGLTYTNQCKLITKGAINNYGTLNNSGLVWAGTTNTAADQFTNSGSMIGAAGSKMRTGNFINYGTITGRGSYYSTLQTTLGSGASVGVTGVTADTIVLFDATRSNPATMFDNQWGAVRNNVVFRAFTAPDSLQVFPGCSDIYKTGAVLPLKWNYFHVKLQQQTPLLTWSAEYETGMKFEIERGYNNADFQVIGSVSANATSSYSYTDITANANGQFIYYRLKGISTSGSIKYSEVKLVKLKEDQSVSLSVYPNPVQEMAVISYKAVASGQVTVRITSVTGHQVLNKTVSMQAGMNRVVVNEIRNLNAGTYFVDVLGNGTVIATEKIVKQ